jgi:antitoxin component of RelBE/YafQ-DinJ toxin-antitoxin module
MENNKRKQTTVMLDENTKKEALRIAKKRGLSTLSTLLNVLMVEYVEKNGGVRFGHPANSSVTL